MADFDGVLNISGQTFVLNGILDKISGLAMTGVYVGLMTSYTGNTDDQIGSGISELSASDYSRLLSSGWILYNVDDPYIKGSTVNFQPSGTTWKSIKGYFIAESETGNDAMWFQPFPITEQGDYPSGYPINLTPLYRQR